MKIKIYNKKKIEVAEMIINKEDYSLLEGKPLYFNKKKNYVTTVVDKKTIGIHKLLLGSKNGFVIDHKNRNGLDNRRENLRFATIAQNSMNRKNSKGYCWDKAVEKWMSYIKINKKLILIGRYKKEGDAINARINAELKYFGEFAPR